MNRLLWCGMVAALAALGGAAWADWSGMPELPNGLRVRPDNRYFAVNARIVPADAVSTLEITPLFDHCRFRDDAAYEMVYTALDKVLAPESLKTKEPLPVIPENGKLTLPVYFAGEQEHIFRIEEIRLDKRRVLGEFHVYSLADDLRALRPFKGDFHMHSHHSDGVESPAYVAGACRRAGFDFMALTDHRKYAPSIEAAEFYAPLNVDLRIYPGEEVHSPDNPVHVVSFGANAGIAELYMNSAEAACRAEVAEIQKNLPALPKGVDPFHYASCVWVTKKIHERGGLAMFCHPYWLEGRAHNVAEALVEQVLGSDLFDMFELVSGNASTGIRTYDENALQAARYAQMLADGKKMPVCGISDAHGCEASETFGRYFTVCFAPDAELASLQAAIKSFRCVAVEIMRGDRPLAHGDYRLVKFTMFLLREIIPQHDELCLEEGALMLRHAAGDATAAARLDLCRGQAKRLYDQYWGVPAK